MRQSLFSIISAALLQEFKARKGFDLEPSGMIQEDFTGDSLLDLLSVGRKQAVSGEHDHSNVGYLNNRNSAISGKEERWTEPLPLRAKSGYGQMQTNYVPVLKKKKKAGM